MARKLYTQQSESNVLARNIKSRKMVKKLLQRAVTKIAENSRTGVKNKNKGQHFRTMSRSRDRVSYLLLKNINLKLQVC